MKVLLRIISVTSLLSVFTLSGTASPQLTDSLKKRPATQWIRSHKTDIKHIAIDLRFDWNKRQAFGTTTITCTPYKPTNTLSLDAGMLTINSIRISTGALLKFNYDGKDSNDGLVIDLDRTYNNNEEIMVIIDYHTNWINETDPNLLGGSDGKGLRFMTPTSAEPKRRKQIWSMGQPESNRYWFPGYDAPNDFRTTELTATVDGNLTVISNGSLTQNRSNPDGTRTFHWMMDKPYANYLTSLVVGEYVDIKQSYEDIELHSFGYPDEAEAVKATVVRLPDMVKYFSEYTGVKYPYKSYSQVFVQDMPWGVENMTTSTQSENMVDGESTHADFFYLWDGLEAEALAHQWFGNYVTCNDWSQVWLNRAFAHYFDELYTEQKNGHDEFLLWNLYGDIGTYVANWNQGLRRPVVTKNYENPAEFKTNDVYPIIRGAMVLHMLRKHLGEDHWRKAIQLYVKSNGGKTVSTEDFRKSVEAVSGESMEWFFDQWVYKMGHPIFDVTRTYDEVKKQLKLVVIQTQKPDTLDEYPQQRFFAGKVEIEIDGRIEQAWVDARRENVFTFEIPQQPKLVQFDFESTWIKEIKFQRSFEELLYQVQNDKDILGRRSAMDELVAIASDATTSAEDKSRIYSAFRNVASSKSYWRIRWSALSLLKSRIAPNSETKPVPLDKPTTAMLLGVIKNDMSWNRAAAISFLGMTRDARYTDIYLSALYDPSDRVINAAANALGKTKSPKAFDALIKLSTVPSWKGQSLISALNGLKELGDPRGFDLTFKSLSDLTLTRWSLPSPTWDFRIPACETLVALGRADSAYPMIMARFRKAMEENDINSIFNNVLLLTKLADPRASQAFDMLKEKFKDDANAMVAVNGYEEQFVKSRVKN